MKDEKPLPFSLFLEYFPKVDPPVSITNDVILEISKKNHALPQEFIDRYMNVWQKEYDEFTEFIPCFSFPENEKFFTLMYWKGSLLSHEFILATVDKKDQTLISQKVVAGRISDGKSVVESVAKIEEDYSIHIMIGASMKDDFDPLTSGAFYMEIHPNGIIESYKEENPLSWLNEKNTDRKN